jgi:hypothetical protein
VRRPVEEDLPVRTSIIALAIAASVLSGCTFKSTTVERAQTPAHTVVEPAPAPVLAYQAPPAVVYQAPPAVVYQAPPTVVYQAPPPTVSAPPAGTVAVKYSGSNGYRLAWQKADSYCVAHYGNARVELLANDETAGRATFGCHRL